MPAVSENRRMNRRGQITSYSTSGAGASGQCHLVFPKLLSLHSWWGGPPGPQPTPTSACWVWMNLISLARSGSRGNRADQGVCPTTASGSPVLGKLSAIGRKRLPHSNRNTLHVNVGQTLPSANPAIHSEFFTDPLARGPTREITL